jgi:alpha-methylacyl-CoA racemase
VLRKRFTKSRFADARRAGTALPRSRFRRLRAPVLTLAESGRHAQSVARHGHVEVGGELQPAPAPRYSRTEGAVRGPPPERGAYGREALADWGFAPAEIDRLRALGVGIKA